MSTVNAYQRERLVDALREQLGDGLGSRALAERLTDRLAADRDMVIHVLGGIDRSHAKEYWDERDDRANEARRERDRLLVTLRLIAAADPVDLALDPTWAQRVAREQLPEYQTVGDT